MHFIAIILKILLVTVVNFPIGSTVSIGWIPKYLSFIKKNFKYLADTRTVYTCVQW